MSSIQETERESAANATAPRVALADIEAAIKEVEYSVVYDILTLAIVIMNNGYIVVGKSAPASPENFNAELGRKFAYEDAVRQIWPLMGFALRERLSIPEYILDDPDNK